MIAQEAHKLSRKTAAVPLADTFAVADTDGEIQIHLQTQIELQIQIKLQLAIENKLLALGINQRASSTNL